jgi:protein gp37
VSDKTGISWTDSTWNPVRGCSRVSEGCRNCYAERVAARFSDEGQPYHGLADRSRKGSKWTGDVRLIPEHLADPLRWKRPRRIFVNSMSDLFHERLTNEQIAAVFGVMAAAPQHTFQVLTKRAKRMREWFEWLDGQGFSVCMREATEYVCSYPIGPDNRLYSWWRDHHMTVRWPLPNVWLGVSVENQEAADKRIPDLLRSPAAVRFLSCEPLIGSVDLHKIQIPDCTLGLGFSSLQRHHDDRFGQSDTIVDWVIAGCESGPGARECKVEWLRSLRDQCAVAGVPFFLKQAVIGGGSLADFVAGNKRMPGIWQGLSSKRKASRVIELPYLDGVQHAQFPEVRHG